MTTRDIQFLIDPSHVLDRSVECVSDMKVITSDSDYISWSKMYHLVSLSKLFFTLAKHPWNNHRIDSLLIQQSCHHTDCQLWIKKENRKNFHVFIFDSLTHQKALRSSYSWGKGKEMKKNDKRSLFLSARRVYFIFSLIMMI